MIYAIPCATCSDPESSFAMLPTDVGGFARLTLSAALTEIIQQFFRSYSDMEIVG